MAVEVFCHVYISNLGHHVQKRVHCRKEATYQTSEIIFGQFPAVTILPRVCVHRHKKNKLS